ncbi:MAG TPA: chemotaxis protein CheW [Syntrophales bacterium]|nr:chemotaxis protein CheW [Syntrophales bacterium]
MQNASREAANEGMPQDLKSKNTREGKYLTFSLKDEEYGIEILKVKEIIGIMNITTIPQTPPYVKGVINLRGKVIPVIDLCLKFGMEESVYADRTCIVVVDAYGKDKGNFFIGIVVDSVSEVVNIRSNEIEDTPNFGVSLDNDYFLGMAKVKGDVKILLDIDHVLTSDLVMAGTLVQ